MIKRKIEQIVTEAGVTESEIVRRGMTHYVKTNPDKYEALRQQDYIGRMVEDLES